MIRIEPTAEVDDGAIVGDGTTIWQLAHVREKAAIGKACTVGRGAYIGAGVEIGDNCKIQNYALIYEPAKLASGVFVGPAAILTNDLHPRAVSPDGQAKSSDDWQPVGVTVGEGASIGARAVCVAPVSIGSWAMVAAGAVVTQDVAPFALVVGVPAHQIGWVGHSGVQLVQADDGTWKCPKLGTVFTESTSGLIPLDSSRATEPENQ